MNQAVRNALDDIESAANQLDGGHDGYERDMILDSVAVLRDELCDGDGAEVLAAMTGLPESEFRGGRLDTPDINEISTEPPTDTDI